jgi:hypothetical protein
MPRTALFVAATVALIAGLATACTDDADSESSASQETVQQLTTRVQRNEMLTALLAIDDLPMHDMNEAILDGEVESSFIPDTRELLRLLAITDWDPSLAEDADAVADHAAELLAALDANDIEAAGDHSTATHEGWHNFTVAAWDLLVADLPEDRGGPSGDDDHGDETTPMADGTATDDHDDSPEAVETP